MQGSILENNQNTIEGYQLSPQQRYLWLLQQSEEKQHERVSFAVLIEGNLNLEILDRALNNVVDRYEILRTNFQCLPGMEIPIQIIRDRKAIWHQQFKSEIEKNIEAIFQDFIGLTFDFDQGSLLHLSLISLAPHQHILLLGLPAICSDVAGMNNLVTEISYTYAAYLEKRELSEEPLQYADIAQWQNDLLATEDGEIGINFWRMQDFTNLVAIQVPYEQKSLEISSSKPQNFTWEIEPEIKNKIQAVVDNEKTSLATFLLACWHILLYRLTGQAELLISTAFSGRKYQELESTIGLLDKYIPLAIAIEDNCQFNELLQKLDEQKNLVSTWQEYFTGEQILALKQSDSKSLSFDFQQLNSKAIAGDITWSIYKHYICLERFNLGLSCVQIDENLNLEFHYDSNLFLAEDIQRLSNQFQVLINSILINPQAKINKLEIISDREKHQLLIEFNQTQKDYPDDKCFHQLFEEQVALTPNNIAVVFEEQKSTYQELNERADRLAYYLQSLGVGAEIIVGICVEKSLEMMVGLLGILKAGGAYLPLDPAYPQERLAFMLEDAQVAILLTQSNLVSQLPKHNAKLICLDTNWETQSLPIPASPSSPLSPYPTLPVTASPRPRVPLSLSPSSLAYIIYTSGSTGKPKGTLITHQGLVNYLSWCIKAYAVEEGNGSCVHSSLAFDATITGLFAPLLVGNKVHLVSEALGIEALADTLANNSNYSLIKITPAQLELLSQQLSPQQAANCTKAFIIGGENLVAKAIAFWQKYAPKTLLINEYGPTETVVGCCIYKIPSDTHHSGSIPIGRPIANTQLYMLDRNLNPVPIGIPGELYIGGAGVAKGYLNRPDLTTEKFIPNPFLKAEGGGKKEEKELIHLLDRLYKTGDLARWLPDGNIEFLGRIDNQVKIRGFRVELGEIEAILNQHPTVQNNVVVLREDEPDNKRLVAYLVSHSKQQISINDLRNFLQEKLPDYMIPSTFVLLKTLPLTTNGKIDRNALPQPENIRPDLAATFIPPRNATEQALANIWTEVLKIEKVGIHDNFFDLGGHSLLLTQVTSRLHNAFGIELSLRQLFATPTIAQLAEIVAQKQIEQTDGEILEQILAEIE